MLLTEKKVYRSEALDRLRNNRVFKEDEVRLKSKNIHKGIPTNRKPGIR